jgi:GNAT superfamily N-acetyltransferase
VARTEDAYDHLASKDCNERIERMAAPFRRSLPQGLNIREATPDDRPAILALCRASLDWGDDPLFERLFSWKHDQNAFGPSYLWVATDGARIVGLRAFMRWEFVRGGEVLHAVRAVDTATHPDYQGKGLFTAMTMHGLEVVEDDGVDFVFNTPNDKSRPGYLKMGWQSVGRIPISVKPTSASSAWRMARSRVASSHWPEPLTAGQPISAVVDQLDSSSGGVSSDLRRLATRKSREYLDWRYGSGFLGYRFVPLGDGGVLVRLRRRGSTKELVLLDSLGLEESETAQVVARVAADASADYTLRIGPGGIRHGFLQIPDGGLAMTWRALNMRAMAPLANWELTMGDVELL